jgi:transposase InsO family protein
VGDITYLRTGEGWPCLATVIDLATRMVVGWAMSERMTADIVVSAPGMAHGRGYVADGAILRSDYAAESAKPRFSALPLVGAPTAPPFAA